MALGPSQPAAIQEFCEIELLFKVCAAVQYWYISPGCISIRTVIRRRLGSQSAVKCSSSFLDRRTRDSKSQHNAAMLQNWSLVLTVTFPGNYKKVYIQFAKENTRQRQNPGEKGNG